MFKQLTRFFPRKSLSSAKYLKIPPLNTQIQRSIFFSFKQDTKPAKKEEEDVDNFKDISFLIKKVKEDNKKLPALLPPKAAEDKDKLTVVLEMDEVLLYVFYPDEHEGYLQAPIRDYDHLLDFKKYDTYLSVYKREHLDDFLAYLKEYTEPILFCQGQKDYVDMVMGVIDKENVFKHKIYQDACSRIEYKEEGYFDFVKDLERLGRSLERTVLIDAKPFCFWANPDNAIPISEYVADKIEKDSELINIIDVLEELKDVKDVRKVLEDRYCIKQALQDSKMI